MVTDDGISPGRVAARTEYYNALINSVLQPGMRAEFNIPDAFAHDPRARLELSDEWTGYARSVVLAVGFEDMRGLLCEALRTFKAQRERYMEQWNDVASPEAWWLCAC